MNGTSGQNFSSNVHENSANHQEKIAHYQKSDAELEEEEFGEFNQADSQMGNENDLAFNSSIEKGISNLPLRMLLQKPTKNIKIYANLNRSTYYFFTYRSFLEKQEDEFGDFADVESADFGLTESPIKSNLSSIESNISSIEPHKMTEPSDDIYAALRTKAIKLLLLFFYTDGFLLRGSDIVKNLGPRGFKVSA